MSERFSVSFLSQWGHLKLSPVEPVITAREFEDRLRILCAGATTIFPRRHRDRHILYRSIISTLDIETRYTEGKLNVALTLWLSDIGAGMEIDHVTLRRYMVDEGYLSRDSMGSTYRVNSNGRGLVEFEKSVSLMDPSNIVTDARQKVAEKKRQHMNNRRL